MLVIVFVMWDCVNSPCLWEVIKSEPHRFVIQMTLRRKDYSSNIRNERGEGVERDAGCVSCWN